MTWQTDIENYYREGDNVAALKARFVELCAKRHIVMSAGQFDGQLTPYAVGIFVFNEAGVIDAEPRGGIIAQHWAKDIGVLEAIETYKLKGPDGVETDENALLRTALQISKDPLVDAKERIKALEFIANVKGYLKKPSETWGGGGGGAGGANQVDFLAALSAQLPN